MSLWEFLYLLFSYLFLCVFSYHLFSEWFLFNDFYYLFCTLLSELLQEYKLIGVFLQFVSLTLVVSCSLKCLVIIVYEFNNFNFNLWDHRRHMLDILVFQRKFHLLLQTSKYTTFMR